MAGVLQLNATTVATESSGAITIIGDNVATRANERSILKGAELNSLGLLKKVFFGFYANLTSTKAVPNLTDTPMEGDIWTEITDPFGKFSSGRWTPEISGYYLVGGTLNCPGIDDGELLAISSVKNGSVTTGNYTQQIVFASATDQQQCGNVSSILYLEAGNDPEDYFSLYAYQNSGAEQTISAGVSTIFAAYLGSASI